MRGAKTSKRDRFAVVDWIGVLFGAPLRDDPEAREREASEPVPPFDWASELDQSDGSEVLELAFDGELEEVLASRIGEQGEARSSVRGPACPPDRVERRRAAGAQPKRRRGCPKGTL